MESRSSRPPSSRRRSQQTEGAYRVVRLNEVVAETSWTGYVTPELFAACDRDYWRLAGEQAIPYVVMNGTAMTGYDATITSTARMAMRSFKDRGGQEYLFVAGVGGVLRMMGSALATASQVGFRIFDTREAAFDYLSKLGVW